VNLLVEQKKGLISELRQVRTIRGGRVDLHPGSGAAVGYSLESFGVLADQD
jgi:hypothetical protein